jgi:S-DNA-T family DNA segregation ATPase FtsK/SpoIIIE
MAKSTKSKSNKKNHPNGSKLDQTKRFIKFEILGLSMITLAILGLAASGWVGKTVDSIFIWLGGNFDWLLECYLIYCALYLMIHRKRITMDARQWGFVVFLLVVLTWSHLNLYDSIHQPHIKESPDMFKVTWERISLQIDYNEAVPVASNGKTLAKPSAGGGMIGYLFFMTTHILFDTAGTLFVLIMGSLISVILITRKSIVTMLGQGRQRAANRLAGAYESLREWGGLLREKQEQKQHEREQRRQEKRAAQDDNTPPWEDEEELAAVAEPDFTVSSFADQLLAEQRGGESEGERFTIQSPRFLQEENSPQIKVQFPTENAASVKPLDSPRISVKGVPHLEEEKPERSPQIEDEHYEIPPLTLLDMPKGGPRNIGVNSVKQNAKKLEQTFESFGVSVKVLNAQIGPTVTQYEVQPATGVKVSRIVSLADDIALALAAKDIRIEAPIPGKSAVGIEVPNTEVAVVTLREVLESPEFANSDSMLTIALGRDISGRPIVGNLAKMPHLLVAGATGSGKSVCVNGIITSILFKAKPSEVKFIMVDPKMVELNVYNGIPHLMAPVVTDPRRAAYALKKVVAEMEQRYELFAKTGCRNIDGYNAMMKEKGALPLPYIVVIVDELADLMMVAPGDVEDSICRLAQMARAAGIHMIIATQRPSVDVITGVIKANIPSRIAFAVSSQVDSRTILDSSGAEKLLGRGDMLYLPVGANKPVRVQGAFLSDAEVERVVQAVKSQQEAHYTVDLTQPPGDENGKGDEDLDELFYEAVKLVVETQQASVSLIQRKLKVGYARAARLVDQMEERGFVGPFEGTKPREVLVTREQWLMMQQQLAD